MVYTYLLILITLCSLAAFFLGRSKAISCSNKIGGIRNLHSLPVHYGMLHLIGCAIPALLLFFTYQAFETSIISSIVINGLPEQYQQLTKNEMTLVLNDIRNMVAGDVVANTSDMFIRNGADKYLDIQSNFRDVLSIVVLLTMAISVWRIYTITAPDLRARNIVEKILHVFLLLCSAIAILTTVGIVLSVLFEAIRFFKIVPLQDFLFGLQWSPQTAIRADQTGSSGAFGAIPVFSGTILIAGIAMAVAIPVGLLSAIYLSEFANTKVRTFAKPTLEILAGIPTVVYGFFAALTVAPLIRETGSMLGISVSSESALAAGLVMGIMIIPFVSSLSDDVIHAVPQALRDGSYGLGATKYETIRNVIIPAALPGIVGGILLAISRAIGETMIVVMAAGLAADLTANPLKAVTTVTVQIVTLLVGDQEFDSPKTLAAFALGLLLFVFTLCLNIIALRVVRKYREQYE